MAGNANSGRRQEKPFRDALILEIKAAGEDHKALRRVAAALLSKAMEGDMQAIKELGDRVDGKVPQGIEGPGDNGEHIINVTVGGV
jgi:hypothetical protein